VINRQRKAFSFQKKERIRKKKDFEKIFLQGKRIKNSCFGIILKGNTLNCRRIAVIVKKKEYREAHIRNKIKRRIREIYRLNKENFPVNTDCVIIIKESAHNLSYQELQNKLLNLLLKYKV